MFLPQDVLDLAAVEGQSFSRRSSISSNTASACSGVHVVGMTTVVAQRGMAVGADFMGSLTPCRRDAGGSVARCVRVLL